VVLRLEGPYFVRGRTMDTGLNIRPVQPSSVSPVRTEAVRERLAARTELPETNVVLAVAEARPVQFDQNDQQRGLRSELNAAIDVKQSPAQAAALQNKTVVRDEASQELVFRTVSTETGEVVTQFPDDAILRQRAYSVQQRRAELDAAQDKSEDPIQKVA
jgi:hypothetical protein